MQGMHGKDSGSQHSHTPHVHRDILVNMGTVHIYMCARLLQQGRFVPFSVSFVHLQASLENQSCICCSADIPGGLTSPNKQPPGKHSTAQCFAEYSLYQDHIGWLLPSRCHPHIFSKSLFHRRTLVLKKTLTRFMCQEGTETAADNLQKAREETALVVWLYCFALYFFHGKKEGH